MIMLLFVMWPRTSLNLLLVSLCWIVSLDLLALDWTAMRLLRALRANLCRVSRHVAVLFCPRVVLTSGWHLWVNRL